jgi:hypothetical protein
MTSILPALRPRVTWAAVEDGFHVASREGEFVGFAERTPDGHFVGFDGRSTPVGRYESLDEAQRAVEDAPAGGESAMSPRTEVGMQAAATISGMVALGALAVAMVTLPGM